MKGPSTMKNIQIEKASEYTISGSVDVSCSFKRDGDSTDSKTVTVRMSFDAVSLKDILTKATKPQVISWQNNIARKRFDAIKDRSIIEVDFTSPAKRVESRDEKVAKAKALFMAAGLDETKAEELAITAVDNPQA